VAVWADSVWKAKTRCPSPPGQEIELTGVMMTVRDREVFVVRNVKANGQTYIMRNEHGIDVSPLTRERAAEKGVTL